MSWVSTELYYRHINRIVNKTRGGLTSAPLIIESLNFDEVARARTDEEWAEDCAIMVASARRLEAAGATAILICANSMHKVHDEISDAVGVPVLHIADAVGRKMAADKIESAALIGTANVMGESWYRQRLVSHGVTLAIPDPRRVSEIDNMIYDELMQGPPQTRNAERALKTIITNYEKTGVDAIVLGCTELVMVVNVKANVLPVYDSTELHARMGADWILGKE